MRSADSSNFIITFAAIILLLLSVPISAQSEDEEHAPEDTIFSRILLDDNGVLAVDTSGYEWWYDFERGYFVAGIPEPKDRGTPADGFGMGDQGREPVEQRCTVEKWVKPFQTRTVTVREDEFVDGDIKVLGRVTIRGWVKGDVQSLRKRVLITETGWVDGDVEAPTVIVREGGYVGGKITEIESPLDFDLDQTSFSIVGLIVTVSFTVLLILLALFMTGACRRQTDRFCSCIEQHKARTFFLGLLMWLMIGPVMALVSITIVGIPLLPLVPLAYIGASIMGTICFADSVGRAFSRRVPGIGRGRLFQTLVGVLLVMSPWFVAATLLGTGGGVAEGFGIFFLVVAIIVTAFPVCAGVGAALLTRYGFQDHVPSTAQETCKTDLPPPAPPPISSEEVRVPPGSPSPPGNDET